MLAIVLAVAVAISVIHYVDNVVNYDDYPQPTSGSAPSQTLVAISWFGFTAFALGAYLLLVRGRALAAAICLAIYAGSGLVGLGHYTVDGATEMVWWRQAHVVADILCGVAVLAFAAWLARRRQELSSPTPAERELA
jgi:Na+/proline symporter